MLVRGISVIIFAFIVFCVITLYTEIKMEGVAEVMKGKFFGILRLIVGPEAGFSGEGNEQWFYTLSLVINLMLIWWLKPEIALLFAILAVVHYVTVVIYGYCGLEDGNSSFSYVYLGIHLILFLIAILTSFKWTIITTLITVVAYFFAPDCTGNNIILNMKSYDGLALLFNTIIFAAFVIVDFLLPIKLWIKLLIIVAALIIHPIIDILEEECIIISDVTSYIFEKITELVKK